MDISALFAGAFETLKRRFALFILLTLAPSILIIVVVVIAGLIGGGGALTGNRTATGGALIAAALIVLVGGVAAVLTQLKSYGMMSLAAYETAQGQTPDFRGLWARTKGYLPRMLPIILIGLGLAALFYLVFFGAIIALVVNAVNSSDPTAAVAGIIGVIAVVILVVLPLGIFLSVRLLYTVPVVAIEQRGSIDALKRSWTLTKGQFGRTFGYWVLAQLAVGAVLYVISLVNQLLGGGAAMRMPNTDNPSDVFPLMLAMLPFFLVSLVLQLAVQLFTTPFLQTYTTFMYVDQVRRSELPPQQYGTGTQPGYPDPQAYGQQQYPGQVPQQYPGHVPQQYPGQSQPGNQQYPGQVPQQFPGQSQPGNQQPQQYPGQQPPQQP